MDIAYSDFGKGLVALIPLLIFLILLIPAIAWARKKSKNSLFSIPMSWYYFYTYVRLPLNILFSIGIILQSKVPSILVFSLIYDLFLIIVLIGLSKLKLWGWYLNVILLIIESFLLSLESYEKSLLVGTTIFIVIVFSWFLPNFIYFKKRKSLFK